MNAAALIIATPLPGSAPDAPASSAASGSDFATLVAGVLAPVEGQPKTAGQPGFSAPSLAAALPPSSSTAFSDIAEQLGAMPAPPATNLLQEGDEPLKVIVSLTGEPTRPATPDRPVQLIGVEKDTLPGGEGLPKLGGEPVLSPPVGAPCIVAPPPTPTVAEVLVSEAAETEGDGTKIAAPAFGTAVQGSTTVAPDGSTAAASAVLAPQTTVSAALAPPPSDLAGTIAPAVGSPPVVRSELSTSTSAQAARAEAGSATPAGETRVPAALAESDLGRLQASEGPTPAARAAQGPQASPEVATSTPAQPAPKAASAPTPPQPSPAAAASAPTVPALARPVAAAAPPKSDAEGSTERAAPSPAMPAGLAAQMASPAVIAVVGRAVAPTRPSTSRPEASTSPGTATPVLAVPTPQAGAVASVAGANPAAPAPGLGALADTARPQQVAGNPKAAVALNGASSSAQPGSGVEGAKTAAPQTQATPATLTATDPAQAAKPSTATAEIVMAEVAAPSREPAMPELRAAETTPTAAPVETRTGPAVVRGAPETVAGLAAEIQRKLEGRNTRFEVALDPAGLGMVNVSIDIGADGRMSAQLAFERPEAAAELRGRSAELQRALEQAGFDLSRGGLSFTGEGGRERSGGDQPRGQHARAHAFQSALLTAEAADALPIQPMRLRDRAGLDVRI